MLMSPLLVAMLATASNSVSPAGMRTGNPAGGPPPAQPVPAASALQKKFIGWDMTAFIHFSITTYTGSQNGNQDPTKFAPPRRR